MLIRQSVPREETIELDRLLSRLSDPATRLAPFSEAVLDFCSRFSTALFRDAEARRYPELQALAFWMRKSELVRMKRDFEALSSESTLLMPRGLVFHIPPSNVDTIFIYSWILSVLTGNANVIRLSERSAGAALCIIRLFNNTLAEQDSPVARSTSMLRYAREREITEAISALTDVRVVWGGDATVNTIRAIPLPAHAQELTFPDRYSLSVAKASSYLSTDKAAREALAIRFYNDMYWFDQMACSSPRVLVWVGTHEQCGGASAAFYNHLEAVIAAKGYTLATGPRLNKLTFAYRAILDQPVTAYREAGPECSVLELEHVSNLRREHCGGGLLFQTYSERLDGISAHILRRDQTLTQFGFDSAELKTFVALLNGRGVDRIVPIGEALNFNRFWDGYDLLRAFTRTVYLQA